MKLSQDAVTQLDTLVQTSLIAGIKKLVIENDKIRGIDEKQTVVILTTNNVPDFNGKQIGITRLDSLAARLNLVKNQGPVSIDATEASNGNDISILDLSSGKVKAQFRCASVEAVKGVPKNVADTLVWEIKFDAKSLPIITQAIAAMGAESVTIASKDAKTVSIELIDTNKDVFTTELLESPVWIGTTKAQSSFCQKYPAKTFVSLLKEAIKVNDPVTIKIGEGGIVSLQLNSFDIFLLPQS
jgi:hypothetical protein